ncbi:hypothetical protein KKE54_03445, partial [bacterium]|nr:hypothetical protein [bacterium]
KSFSSYISFGGVNFNILAHSSYRERLKLRKTVQQFSYNDFSPDLRACLLFYCTFSYLKELIAPFSAISKQLFLQLASDV